MKYDNETLQGAIEHLIIEDWLSDQGIDFKIRPGSSGEQINIKECPRCGGRKWKVFLNRETGLGNCFHGDCVGQTGFNKFSFIAAYLGSNAQAAGSIVSFVEASGYKVRPKKTTARVFVSENFELPTNISIESMKDNLPYLENRGISIGLAGYFRLAYCHHGTFSAQDEAGNILGVQDFSQRVLIPVYDLEGNLVTFQGRDITNTSDKKYLFPAGLPSSGMYLYNGHNAIGAETVIICEGAFDVMAATMALSNDPILSTYTVVGSFGKHLSMSEEGQLGQIRKLVEKGTRRFIIMWDGEKKTIMDACDKALELTRAGFKVAVAILPKDKDPNEVPPQVVCEAVRQSVPITSMSAMTLKSRALLR